MRALDEIARRARRRQIGNLLLAESVQALSAGLGGWKVGLLINFNVPLLRDGIRRRVLGLEE